MIYRVLGDLEIRGPGGRPVELPGGHQLSVLAALLMRPNQQLSAVELLRAGWGTTSVQVAQLHKAVSAARKLLSSAGRPRAIQTHNRFGYELRAADDDLDLLRFRRHIARADAERTAQRTVAEIDHLRHAIRLWHGRRPLANLPEPPFAADVESLIARRKRTAVRLFALELARGEHAAVLDDLAQFAAEDPADGQLCRQLMLALYRSGHATDATEVLERHEEAIGGSADRELRRLGYAMALHNDAAVARAGDPSVRVPRAAPLPRQLPPATASFVGREAPLAEIRQVLREGTATVVVIPGPGGMGKTALALRAAHEFADSFTGGQLWADLRGTSDQPVDPGEVLAEFLRALGETTVPERRRERVALFRSLTAERRLLIGLDDAVAVAQIRDLVPAGRGCVVLVTTRRRLPGLDAPVHHVTPLTALDHGTAGALFRHVVESAQVDLSAEAEAVDAVVRLCGGLPLALRIAAQMRVEDFHRPTAALLERLAGQGPAGFQHGDDSLARTIGAGLAPLDDRARRLFLSLGRLRFPSFGEWTAAALLEDTGPAAAAALAHLALVGMIDPESPGTRYGFHDLTRAYARDRADVELPAPERTAAPARACRALLTLTRRAHEALYGGQFDVVHSALPDVPVPESEGRAAAESPRAWFEAERLTIRAAVSQAADLGLADLCWDLAVSAHEFYALGAHFDDWRATHEIALRACRRAGERRGEGMLLVSLGQPPLVASGSAGVSGPAELERAVALLAEAGDWHGRAVALRTLANALRRRGELTRPLDQFTEALVHYRESGDLIGVQQTLRFIGQTHLDRGDHGAAVATLREAERMARATGQPQVLAPTLYWKGQALLAQGDRAGAGSAFDEVLRAFPDGGIGHAYALHGLGELARATGEREAAAARLARAAECARDGGDVVLEGRVQLSVAALETNRAEQEIALVRAVELFQSCGAAHLEVEAQAALAGLYASLADQPEAEAAARDRIRELYADVPPGDRRLMSY
ncbi:winged helix-turn-helix domain-containing protein [Actinoplanes bogorensis]|uniref:Winged helix-turn-helix domain-containing protein n=1 Tax=Paractinoplanes bogorensis TaxID=1610840 RepID=A0ABS5YXN6_9ACTN|nr:BTAD domain-containing putative transcriptional regulator [Actinoplanes bogorensis]MBU2668207.1 winged helix-turn-helix domain-containing protein [Actinoplanes bogorensis]